MDIFSRIQTHLKNVSFGLVLGLVTFITFLSMLIIVGIYSSQITARIVLLFCFFLWGTVGFSLIFKERVSIGPISVSGNFVKVFGYFIIIYNWTLVGYFLFHFY